MKSIIEDICRNLTDEPELVKVKEVKGERSSVFEISCGVNDIGKILGRQGQNIHAIRRIVSSIASKNKTFASVEVLENR